MARGLAWVFQGLLPGGDEDRAKQLPSVCTIDLHTGDVVRILTPGGGGWGARAGPRMAW